MATPSPEGTTLIITPVVDGTAGSPITVGCVTQITLSQEAKTTEPDIITSAGGSGASAWSGQIVTGKTMTLEVSGYAKDEGVADNSNVFVGGIYTISLTFGTDLAQNFTGLEWVLTRRQIEASGTSPVTYSLSFTINTAAIC